MVRSNLLSHRSRYLPRFSGWVAFALAFHGWLAPLALAQPDDGNAQTILNLVQQGQRAPAAELWDNIDNSRTRNGVANQMADAMTTGGNPGGGALADFDTLINLITSTVEPDSWETNGGVGAMQGFPAGVYVDAGGCLRRTKQATADQLRASVQRALKPDTAFEQATWGPGFRKISLPRLERAWMRRVLAGEEIPDEMYRLAGLQRIAIVAIHEATGDVILAGPANDQGPSLSLDAWLHVFQNAMHGDRRFGCSIEPRPKNIADAQQFIQQSSGTAIPPARRDWWSQQLRDRLGQQQILVHGLDPRSHAARIIVAADYHMKLIGMGIESAEPYVPSYLSMVELGPGGRPPAMDVLRWWFTLDYDRLECDQDRTIFRLVGNAVRVQCENEFLTEQGQRVHTGTAEPKNQEFAEQFTRQINDLAKQYPIYRQLQGLFDLSIAAALIRDEGLADKVGWEPMAMLLSPAPTVAGAPVATDVETVVHVRDLNERVFITGVSGGVDVDPGVIVKAMVTSEYPMQDARKAMAPQRPYKEDPRWWWD